MTAVYEGTRLDNAIYDWLAADSGVLTAGTPALNTQTLGGAALRLWDTEPPQSATGGAVVYPLLILQQQAVTPDDCLDFGRPGVEAVYLVKGIAAAGQPWSSLAGILDAVDARLQGARWTAAGYLFTVLAAEGSVKYIDPPAPGGTRARHMGRLWRIVAEPS